MTICSTRRDGQTDVQRGRHEKLTVDFHNFTNSYKLEIKNNTNFGQITVIQEMLDTTCN